MAFAFESGTRFGYEPTYASWPLDQGNDPAIFSGPAEQIVRDEDFVKMLIRHIEIRPDDLLERVRSISGACSRLRTQPVTTLGWLRSVRRE